MDTLIKCKPIFFILRNTFSFFHVYIYRYKIKRHYVHLWNKSSVYIFSFRIHLGVLVVSYKAEGESGINNGKRQRKDKCTVTSHVDAD